MLLFFEIGATVAGLTEGVLIMLNKRVGWVVYIIEVIFTMLFSIFSRLYGDVINNFIYLILGISSLILWSPKRISDISKCKARGVLCYVAISIVGSVGLFMILKNTDDPLPLLDAVSTCTSFVADYLMMTRKIDTWYVWLFNDIIYCIEYLLLPNQAFYLLTLNILWTVLAIVSLFNWNRIMKEEKCKKYISQGNLTLKKTLQKNYQTD